MRQNKIRGGNMDLKKELLAKELAFILGKYIEEINPNIVDMVKNCATEILGEVQKILSNDELNDFEVVEEIVLLFEKNHLSCGGRHDF